MLVWSLGIPVLKDWLWFLPHMSKQSKTYYLFKNALIAIRWCSKMYCSRCFYIMLLMVLKIAYFSHFLFLFCICRFYMSKTNAGKAQFKPLLKSAHLLSLQLFSFAFPSVRCFFFLVTVLNFLLHIFLRSATLMAIFTLKLHQIIMKTKFHCIVLIYPKQFVFSFQSTFERNIPQSYHLQYINLALYQVMAPNLIFDGVEWLVPILRTLEVALAFCTEWSKWTPLTFVLNTVATPLPLHILTQLPLTTIDRCLHITYRTTSVCLASLYSVHLSTWLSFCPKVWLYNTQMFVSSHVRLAYAKLLTNKQC